MRFLRAQDASMSGDNAGIAGKAAPITEQSDEDWQLIIA